MKTGRYELVLVWTDGNIDVYTLPSERDALARGLDFKMIFGNQIQWYGVRPQYEKANNPKRKGPA